VEESEKRLNEVNEGRGEFPMVLGRSLNKIGGGVSDMQAKPSESYDMIRHELIFREIAEQVKEVNSEERERDCFFPSSFFFQLYILILLIF